MSLQDRFERFVIRDGNTTCWLWTGCLQPRPSLPYGRFQIGDRAYYAHRISYQLYRGEIPDGLYVLHKCDVPYCVNPDHFFLGTKRDNTLDKERKNRGNHPFGIEHHQAKIDDEVAKSIKLDLAAGASTRGLAREYGLHRSSIMDIKRGRTWKHVRLD